MPKTNEIASNVRLLDVLLTKHPRWRDRTGAEQHGVLREVALRRAKCFAINFLTATQRPLVVTSASPIANRFERVAWSTAATGTPLLADTSGWLECRVQQAIEVGDHKIVIGRVAGVGTAETPALTRMRGTYGKHIIWDSRA